VRYERVTRTREAEAEAMLAYQRASGCRMRFLAEALDDPWAADCGRCDRCAGAWYPGSIPVAARRTAAERLARAGVEVAPRAQWPAGMDRLGVPVRGRIPEPERVATGRTVARLTDLGWGGRLRALLDPATPDAAAGADLLRACVEVLRQWEWRRRPVAVAAIPTRRRPRLVASVARHLADVGRLAWLGPLDAGAPGPRGGPGGQPGRGPGDGPGGNSAFRLAGLWDGFSVPEPMRQAMRAIEDAPVLLVDDLIDSRWTVCLAGRALRLAGAGEVLPFALAVTA
jgi:ATP-dependent DNA helicase RecQ